MAKLDLSRIPRESENSQEEDLIEIPLEMEPFNGDAIVWGRPKTRELVKEAGKRAKQNSVFKKHRAEECPGSRACAAQMGRWHDGQPDEAFVQEMADLLIAKWEGIEDDGVIAECNRDNKILLFSHVEVGNHVVAKCSEYGAVRKEKAQKNSVS